MSWITGLMRPLFVRVCAPVKVTSPRPETLKFVPNSTGVPLMLMVLFVRALFGISVRVLLLPLIVLFVKVVMPSAVTSPPPPPPP